MTGQAENDDAGILRRRLGPDVGTVESLGYQCATFGGAGRRNLYIRCAAHAARREPCPPHGRTRCDPKRRALPGESSSSAHPLWSGYARSRLGRTIREPQRPAQPPLRTVQAMRDTTRRNRRRRPTGDVPETRVEGTDARPEPDAEARELLEHGLRILARLAVRAYLRREASLPAADLAEQRPANPAEGRDQVCAGCPPTAAAIPLGIVRCDAAPTPRSAAQGERRCQPARALSIPNPSSANSPQCNGS